MLKVGDTVMWRGRFGAADPVPAVVKKISIVQPGEKYGYAVDEVAWEDVPTRVVVDLDNDHWCYGRQIERM